MARRLPHFLTPARGNVFPARLVALDADAASAAVPGHAGLERESLVRWCACGWDTSGRGVRRAYTGAGTTAGEWWAATQWALKRGGQTWIVSPCASRVWGLVGIWRLIESGALNLVGGDERDQRSDSASDSLHEVQQTAADGPARTERPSADRVSGVSSSAAGVGGASARAAARAAGGGGYIVLEDPPSCAALRSPGCSGRLLIADARNWSIPDAPAGLDCAGRAAWLADVMSRFCALLERERLGSLQVTAGSQAMYSFRRAHLTHAMHVHTSAAALALERDAYCGGRCEARRIGPLPAPVYHLDFRSLYGSICAVSPLPALLSSAGTGPPPVLHPVLDGAQQLVSCVTVETDEPAYPFRREGLVIYPTGRFVTALCGPELADAQERGRIRTWHSWACYVGTPCLRAYAQHMLGLLSRARAEGDLPLCQIIKRLIVSIVGKMGQRDWRWLPAPELHHSHPWDAWIEIGADRVARRARSLGWQCQVEDRGEWAPNAIPAIAAWVCSAGRVALLGAIRTAGWGEVYYHDTDSLITSEAGYRRLLAADMVRDSAPGFLRVLGVHGRAEVLGVKHYSLDGALTCSGAPGGAVESGPDGKHYWFRRWLKSAVQRGQRPEPERELRAWSRAGAYRHGRVMADGRVEPWVIQ